MARILYWGFLLILFTPCFFQNEAWVIERLSIVLFFTIISFFIKKDSLKLTKFDFYISIFFIFQIVLSIFRDNFYESIYSIFWFLSLFLGSILLRNIKYTRLRRNILFTIYYFDFLIIADYFNVFNYLMSFFKYGFLSQRGELIDSSLWFINGNMLGNFLLFAAIPGVIYARKFKRFYLLNLFHAFAIFLTGNFTALFIFISIHIFNISKNKYFKKTLILSAIILGILFSSYIIFSQNINSSLYHRKILYKTAIEQIIENPIFGSGAGLFRYNYYRLLQNFDINKDFDYLPPSHYVHNDYLQIISENGFFGIILIFLFFNLFFKNKNNQNFIYIFAFSIIAFVQHILYSERALFLFIIFLCSYNFKNTIKIKTKYIKLSIFILLIYFIFIFIGALGFEYSENPPKMEVFSIIRPGYSFLYTNIALAYGREKNNEKTEEYYVKSIKYDKFWGEHYYRYGRFLINNNEIKKSLENFKIAINYNNLRRKFEIAQEALYYTYITGNKEEFEYFYELSEKNIFFEDQRVHFESIKKRLKNN
ncbi:MAG: hypothetical protein M0R46_07475 [Candidatus Muirbacterium halophilum]|nr:hypothetical protein [Candidatus Muirbacterium halophilum]MCK9475740.1 hypothetical protein [Candidatus Muirbacterium halophilum]